VLFQGTLIYGLAALGLVVALKLAFAFISFVYRLTLRPPVNLSKYGSWAVVTGSTDGIGKAYALALAKHGLNVFLISRSNDKLKEVKSEIEEACKNKVSVRTMAVDFSKASKATYLEIRSQLSTLDVGILVNNVGVSYEHCEFFHDVPDETIDNLIKINIEATTYMTKNALPAMLAKGKGCIINLSSISGVAPAPLLAAYGASKAYVDHFSRMLAIEYAAKGIFIQSVTPAFVTTKMSRFRRSTMTIPTTDAFVRSAIRTIGYERSVAGYWAHDIMREVQGYLPPSLLEPKILAQHLAFRKKYLAIRKAQ
jgi:17beta-estradiol 17-dehydrogenase / very-long-chain 3-oxoacyl-CoA reductase